MFDATKDRAAGVVDGVGARCLPFRSSKVPPGFTPSDPKLRFGPPSPSRGRMGGVRGRGPAGSVVLDAMARPGALERAVAIVADPLARRGRVLRSGLAAIAGAQFGGRGQVLIAAAFQIGTAGEGETGGKKDEKTGHGGA